MHIKRMGELGEERRRGLCSNVSDTERITHSRCVSGSISRTTLQQMSDQKVENLWECFECVDASL